MTDLKDVPWYLILEDEIWTDEPKSRYVGNTVNPDYPSNSSMAQYIVDMHNAQIDKIENSLSLNHFDYEKMVGELREGA